MNPAHETLGDWRAEGSPTLSVTFHTDAWPLAWESCSDVAGFVSTYTGSIVADSARSDAPELRARLQSEAEHAINYILNELVENSYKFSAGGDIEVRIEVSGREMIVRVRNRIRNENVEEVRAAFQQLLSEDTEELFLQRIEASAADPESSSSGLGFLTIMNDYGGQLAWEFSPSEESGHTWLTTMTRFSADGVSSNGN